jgi:hypothetical protein
MEAVANRVNIHFENKLAGKKVSHSSSFDFIYFLLNNDSTPLFTQERFEDAYLEHLSQLGFQTNYTNCADVIKDWWVREESSEITKKLNSKVYLLDLLNKHDLTDSESVIVSNKNEFDLQASNFNLIREEYSVSGRGTYKVGEGTPKVFPVILTNHKNRICDIGTRVCEGVKSHYFNLVDSQFCFRGQYFDEKKIFKSRNQELFNKLDVLTHKLDQVLTNEFSALNYQIDSFIFKENGKLHLEFAHEINYRRSMGDIYLNLKSRSLIKHPCASLVFLFLPKRLDFTEVVSKFSAADSILPLSPMKKGLNLFFIQGDDPQDLIQKLEGICQEVGLSKKAVYNDLVQIIKRVSLIDER